MSVHKRRLLGGTMAAAAAVALVACSGGGGGNGDENVEITLLVQTGGTGPAWGEALIEAFNEEHPEITVTLNSQPGGTEGDNLVKTKLATGEMEDVFTYNTGSLLQAINPDQNLVPLGDEEWASTLIEPFVPVVSTENGLYGAPNGTSQAGGILYNIPIYEELGLEVPTSWDEFMSNNDAIKEAGKTAIIQTYGDTWTSQLFVLGDFGNVTAQDEDWATEYTAGNRKYVEQPALQSFINQQEAYEGDYFNEDFASALFDDGLRMVSTGEGAHYPILSGGVSTIAQNYPDNIGDVGFFPLPAQDAEDTRATIWLPNAVYIPSTTEGEELEAAKLLVEFVNSPEGCRLQVELNVPAGPFATSLCELPSDVPQATQDLQTWVDDGLANPALEFVSPIKGPNLENITVQVGSGISTAEEGAALYDEDVIKQAQQLGLEGW
ncbi:ABC transporter substrate-binding protein [Pseudactinotalea terrae]|uniref:ABC transporter substrate-binding protein n=1 Tax=Pseudactinotalea terrae TaxID=1743262 RepID=UPI0012E1780C|nr:ABC transporter substrate-binding protein [Pseudactinotalea terrae]